MLLEQAVFAPDLSSPRQARACVRNALAAYGITADTAVLLISELATNAVLHARTDFIVRVLADGDDVRVEVEDANDRPPVIAHTPPEATSGRGLHLVQRMASCWGVEGRHDGKVVWFEVPVDSRDRRNAFVS